ncbi:MAG: YbhB/YbcL family Raf kinase inhibitor-like protein [Polyangiaceae bacterium]
METQHLTDLPKAVLGPPSASIAGLSNRRLGVDELPRFPLSSADFRDGEPLPTRSSVDGDGAPPPLAWGPVPGDPRSFVLVCEDPDAPTASPFVHWLVYSVPGHVRALENNVSEFREGTNGRKARGYRPAAPPAGSGPHRYYFELFALDVDVSLPPGASREDLLEAMVGHVVAWGELVGTYRHA